jgi:hypothetical protein
MSRITWSTNVNAPGCLGEIVGPRERVLAPSPKTGRQIWQWQRQTILIQSDWDYPSVAQSFGWDMRGVQKQAEDWNLPDAAPAAQCDHTRTDGTVTCPDCGLTATDFIVAASDWLANNDGATAEDPGYFQ